MYVARHKATGKYRKVNRRSWPVGYELVDMDKATVYRSEQGAKQSITYNVASNRHLLDAWEIECVRLTTT